MSEPIGNRSYLQRDRADAFGAVADDYDRFRPSYPAALVDDLAALRPGTVLDVGCGTGKAARLLLARGLSVLGVEPDPKMAQVARTHGLDVEDGRFETWDERGRRFDLIISGQAWHWVEPSRGAPKAARLLRPRGMLALFWNYDEPEPAARDRIDEVYARLEPQLLASARERAKTRDLAPFVADLKSYGGFADVRTQVYPWQRRESVPDWVARFGTHSDHLLLGPQRLRALQLALADALTDAETLTDPGGEPAMVRSSGGTHTIWARRPD